MGLHERIMNIQPGDPGLEDNPHRAYNLGHRDARHAAAELAAAEAAALTGAQLNHLRRLLGWIQCEVGQEPAAMVKTVQNIADRLDHAPISDEAKGRLVEAYRDSASVPQYVRAALKSLSAVVASAPEVHQAPARHLTDEQFLAVCNEGGFGAAARGEFPVIPPLMLRALLDSAVSAATGKAT